MFRRTRFFFRLWGTRRQLISLLLEGLFIFCYLLGHDNSKVSIFTRSRIVTHFSNRGFQTSVLVFHGLPSNTRHRIIHSGRTFRTRFFTRRNVGLQKGQDQRLQVGTFSRSIYSRGNINSIFSTYLGKFRVRLIFFNGSDVNVANETVAKRIFRTYNRILFLGNTGNFYGMEDNHFHILPRHTVVSRAILVLASINGKYRIPIRTR